MRAIRRQKGACKLIGKMVVKVNLVGSQGTGSRLAQVARGVPLEA